MCLNVGHDRKHCKTDQRIEMPLGSRFAWPQGTVCVNASPGNYNALIRAAAAIRVVATTAVATCFNFFIIRMSVIYSVCSGLLSKLEVRRQASRSENTHASHARTYARGGIMLSTCSWVR